eukprot:scaffold3389_cov119-Cylindrotheca_fusiformis.AAC.1
MRSVFFLLPFLPALIFADDGQVFSALSPNEDDGSLAVAPPISPDCWLDTMREMGVVQMDTSACLYLDAPHQQALSLQLTQCHLQTMGRPVIDSLPEEDTCWNIQADNVADCLPRISGVAATTYTLFFKDIQSLCSRLLQESISLQYLRSSQELAQVSKLAESRLNQMVEQQEQAMYSWHEREASVTQWLETHARQASNQTLQLQEELQLLQKRQLQEHKEELQSLANTVQETRLSITPFSKVVEYVLAHAGTGYSIIKVSVISFGILLTILLFTAPQRFKWMRFQLCTMTLVAAGIEIALHFWFVEEEELSLVEQRELIGAIQGFAYSALISAYLKGVLSSLCCRRESEDNNNTAVESEQERMHWVRQEELLQRLEQWNRQFAIYEQQQHSIPSPHMRQQLRFSESLAAVGATTPGPVIASQPEYATGGGANPLVSPTFSSLDPNNHYSSTSTRNMAPWVYQGIPVVSGIPGPKEDIDRPPSEVEMEDKDRQSSEMPEKESSAASTGSSHNCSKAETKKRTREDVHDVQQEDGMEQPLKRHRVD